MAYQYQNEAVASAPLSSYKIGNIQTPTDPSATAEISASLANVLETARSLRQRMDGFEGRMFGTPQKITGVLNSGPAPVPNGALAEIRERIDNIGTVLVDCEKIMKAIEGMG